jgi:hypothetical protein
MESDGLVGYQSSLRNRWATDSSFGTLAGGSLRTAVFAGDDALEQARLAIAAYFRCHNLPPERTCRPAAVGVEKFK